VSKQFYEAVVKKIFLLPHIKDVPLDSKERTCAARDIILNHKPFLKRFYCDMYAAFQKTERELAHLKGDSLELGSGGGFLKDVMPGIITSDIDAYEHVDRVEDAHNLSFAPGSLKAIYMFDVLHHLGNSKQFFREASRCLVSGGRVVMIEPYGSLWGRFVYRYLHHEPYDDATKQWEFPTVGPLSSANGALPTMIFHRDRAEFERLFPELKIKKITYHTFILYLVSGGVSMRPLVPSFLYGPIKCFEKMLTPFMGCALGTFQTIELEKI
jgi:SAM-dependent methyltransferase